MMASELTLARSGALDTDLLAQQPFYGTNYTKPLLFIEDGAYFANEATALGLTGSQWGVMNETGSYPGQPWLWLYTLWYQVPGWTNSANIDMIAIYMTGLATILLLSSRSSPDCATSPASSRCTGSSGGTGTAPRRAQPTGTESIYSAHPTRRLATLAVTGSTKVSPAVNQVNQVNLGLHLVQRGETGFRFRFRAGPEHVDFGAGGTSGAAKSDFWGRAPKNAAAGGRRVPAVRVTLP